MKILQAIVANYLETGEPVGSRTISKYTDLNLSSATIRNEMADLEESGYIEQPHTSAGRIPTDAGYRVYVDQLMQERDTEVAEMRQEREGLLERVDRMEVMLKQVAKVLAYNTNYAAMITAPQNQQIRVKFLQLTMVDDHHILAVIVVDGNVIKNQLVEVEEPLGNDEVLKLSILMNSFLQGASLSDINIEMIQTMKVQAGIYADVLRTIPAHLLQNLVGWHTAFAVEGSHLPQRMDTGIRPPAAADLDGLIQNSAQSLLQLALNGIIRPRYSLPAPVAGAVIAQIKPQIPHIPPVPLWPPARYLPKTGIYRFCHTP